MILASQESIREWTGKGVWGKKTVNKTTLEL